MERLPLDPVCRLHERHDLSGFDCGVASLNRWLGTFALSDQAGHTSVSYVAGRSGRVLGFYTLAPHSVDPADAGGRLSAGLPRRPIPVLLLARLAVDRSQQGRGLGADLLRDALRRCAGAADEIGGRAVVVHAKDEAAAAFYRRFGFVPLAENPQHLCVLMKDLRASIRASVGPKDGP